MVKQLHPTIKPSELIERIILASSNKNDLILDLFSGSGIASILAKKNKRNFIAIEKNEKYVNMSIKKCKEINIC